MSSPSYLKMKNETSIHDTLVLINLLHHFLKKMYVVASGLKISNFHFTIVTFSFAGSHIQIHLTHDDQEEQL